MKHKGMIYNLSHKKEFIRQVRGNKRLAKSIEKNLYWIKVCLVLVFIYVTKDLHQSKFICNFIQSFSHDETILI